MRRTCISQPQSNTLLPSVRPWTEPPYVNNTRRKYAGKVGQILETGFILISRER